MADFEILNITDEVFARMWGKSFKQDCTTPREELRYLRVLHKDIDGNVKQGEMVCHQSIAQDLIEIFQALYEANYPIERMELVDEYDADDEQTMSANNSSAFNFRFISYTNIPSHHGLGVAVDINPRYNPYVKMVKGEKKEWLSIEPANGADYVDRSRSFPYKIEPDDLCCRVFKEHGFTWGGDWTDSKDYQHFEKVILHDRVE